MQKKAVLEYIKQLYLSLYDFITFIIFKDKESNNNNKIEVIDVLKENKGKDNGILHIKTKGYIKLEEKSKFFITPFDNEDEFNDYIFPLEIIRIQNKKICKTFPKYGQRSIECTTSLHLKKTKSYLIFEYPELDSEIPDYSTKIMMIDDSNISD